jgi:hypothetical protein
VAEPDFLADGEEKKVGRPKFISATFLSAIGQVEHGPHTS